MSKIFISYRREDTAGYAISVHDRLADRFGADQIFMDIDSIEPGEDFVEVINEKIGACDVLLVLIGREWLTCKDESGQRRLHNQDDFVRLEVTAALERKIRIVPVLVGGARLPRPDELPTELVPLCRRNAVTVTDVGFRQDLNRLMEGIQKVVQSSTSPANLQRHPEAENAAPKSTLIGSDTNTGTRISEPQAPIEEIIVGQERVFRDHNKPVKSVAFSPDSIMLASAGGGSWFGGGDTTIRLWHVSDGRVLRSLAGHEGTVAMVRFSPCGDLLASCDLDVIRVWDPSSGKCIHRLRPGATNIAFSADGTKLISWITSSINSLGPWETNDIVFSVWSVPDGKLLDNQANGDIFLKGDFRHEKLSPDGRMAASGELIKGDIAEYWAIVLKSFPARTPIRELKDRDTGGPMRAVFSADGRYLASSYFSTPIIRLWRIFDGKLLAKIEWPGTAMGFNTANDMAFAPNSKWLAAGCEDDKHVRIWPLLAAPRK